MPPRPVVRLLCLHVILAATVTAAPSSAASGAAWPAYKGDSGRSGVTTARLRLPLARVWSFTPLHPPRPAWPEPGRELHSMDFDYAFQPVVVEGLVFFGSSADDTMRALRLGNGKRAWAFTAGGPIRFAPAVHDGRLFVASDDGWLYCLEARTGELVWSFRAAPRDDLLLGNGRMISRWPLRSGVLVADGVVYVTAGMWPMHGIYVYALDVDTGRQLWCNDSSGHMYVDQPHKGASAFAGVAPQGCLVLAGDKLLVPTGRGVPAAFDRSTGRLLYYHQALCKANGGAWVTSAGGLFFNPMGGGAALKARTGELPPRWRSPLRNTFQGRTFAGPGRLGRRHSHDRGGMIGYAAATGEARIKLPSIARVLRHGLVLYAVGDGKAQALSIRTLEANQGKRRQDQVDATLWETAHPRPYAIALARLADRDATALLVGGPGSVTAFGTTDGTPLWSGQVPGQARGIAVVDGVLLVTASTGAIVCFAAARDGQIDRAKVELVLAGTEPGAAWGDLAARVVRRSGVTQGYALAVGGEAGFRLGAALARQGDLHVLAAVEDANVARSARAELVKAGLNGTRVAVHQVQSRGRLPFAPYFADLVVAARGLGSITVNELYRALRPCGGVMLFPGLPDANVRRLVAEAGLPAQEVCTVGGRTGVVRGHLPGAGDWRYARADPGRTGIGSDTRVRLPLELLWFGGPGPDRVLECHRGGSQVLWSNGRAFVLGEEQLIALNAYNGRELWSRQVADGAARLNALLFARDGHVVQPGFTVPPTENFVADQRSIFVAVGESCLEVDQGDGRVVRTLVPPARCRPCTWRWVTVVDGRIIGTAMAEGNIREANAVFALDRQTGKVCWVYEAQRRVPNTAVAVGDGKLFLLDVTSYAEALQQKRQGGQPAKAESLVALDLRRGTELWHNDQLPETTVDRARRYVKAYVPWDYLQYGCGTVLLSGTAAFDATTGVLKWHEQHRVRMGSTHDLIHGDWVIGDPHSYELATGKPRWAPDPVTGARRLWRYTRGYGCGNVAGCRNLLFFRSANVGFLGLACPYEGVSNFPGVRPGCGITMVAAGGLLVAPEGSAGCRCSYNFQTSFALAPAPREREVWSLFEGNWGGKGRIQRGLYLNLGAVGDRADPRGKAWLGLPRPAMPDRYPSLPVTLGPNAAWYYHPLNTEITGTDCPWLYSSGVRNPGTIAIQTAATASAPESEWTVRLHFAELEAVPPGERVFDIKLQGETVLRDFDIARTAGIPRAAIAREFEVRAGTVLQVELVPHPAGGTRALPPILSAIELERADTR